MDIWTTLGMAMGTAWLSGINLYATVLTLGLLKRFDLVTLPGDLGVVGNWWVIGLAGVLYAIEFIADKVPAVDSVWDGIHTFIRVPAGAILAATAFASFDPAVRIIAMLAGGGVALSSHGTKAATRLAANTSPEPVSNIALSLIEDFVTVGSAILMVFHPIVILVIVGIFVIFAIWAIPKILRAIRRVLERVREVFSVSAAAKLILVGLITVSLGTDSSAATTPTAAVKAFFELLKTEKYDALYQHLPTKLQERVSRSEFTASVKRIGDRITLARMDVGKVQQKGNYAVVDTTVYGKLRDPVKIRGELVSEGRVHAQQILIKEDKDWKVISADDRVRAFFAREDPKFVKDFKLTPPRFEFKQAGKWQLLQ